MAARWAEQTPDDFVMHVKAFGVMTRHPVKKEQLPTDLRDAAPVDEKGRIDRPPREFRAEVFTRFREALEPLRSAGKLGGTLFQFPPYVVYKDLSLDYLAWAGEQMGDDEMLVEFRHSSWYEEDVRDEVLSFLEEHGMSLVVVDAPKVEAKNVPRTLLAVTGPTVYVRFHGRNEKTWNARGGSAAERFDYLYSEDELREWVEPLRELAATGRRTPTRSSTTTTAHRATAATAGMSRRARRTRRCSRGCLQRNSCSSSLKRFRRSTFVKWPAPSSTSRRPFGADSTISRASSAGRNGSSLPTTTQSGPLEARARSRSSRAGRAAPRSRGSAPPPSARAEAARARSAPRLRSPARGASRSRRCGPPGGRHRRRRPRAPARKSPRARSRASRASASAT